jgi:serine/threonine protein kinase/tetratricopeptide (TPR) repeat protein
MRVDDPDGTLRRLFGEAVERARAGGTSFPDATRFGDAALRDAVDELVLAHDRAVEMLVGEHSDDRAEDGAEAAAGERVGPYRLVRQIGEGGFGTVYLAEQRHPVRRAVAVKVIKPGMDTRRVIARFEAERQVLALMDHPHVARVLDAGSTEAGRPYFVMELVDGSPLTEYCDAARLDLRARLGLFERVCLAVHHAHQKGVIHRDLKPTNVLVTTVDDVPVPKVIDFGVARALHERPGGGTLFTEGQHVIGTPAYMSPEQAQGAGMVDTRGDIYSLGAVLYELLTGVTPFDAAALRDKPHAEVQRTLAEVEPPRPSDRAAAAAAAGDVAVRRRVEAGRLPKLLRGELDWIVMKCLEKDPARRYETAGDLAADVRRHLGGEPVSAGPPAARYRLRKYVARHKPLIATLTTVAATLLVGTGLATWGMIRAERARRSEARERSTADAINLVLQDMLSSVDPDKGGGREVLVREVLDAAARKLDDGALRDQPEVEAAVRGTLGRSYVALGDVASAEPQLRSALELHRRVDGDVHADVAAALYDLGTALQLKRDASSAAEVYRQSVAMFRGLSSGDDPALLRCLTNYGIVLGMAEDFTAAEAALHEALDMSRRLRDDAAAAKCVHCLAGVNMRKGENAAAAAQLREALAGYRKTLGPHHRQTVLATGQLGVVLANLGELPEAERLMREHIAITTRLSGDTHPHVVETKRTLADVLGCMERGDEARQLRDEAIPVEIEQLSRAIGRDPNDYSTLRRRADDYAELGRIEEALADFDRVIALQPQRPSLRAARANALARNGRFAEALADLSAALDMDGDDHFRWYLSACLSAYLAGTEDHRSRAREMLRRFGPAARQEVAERTAKAAALLPGAVDPSEVVGLAGRALRTCTVEQYRPFFRMTNGIAEYRAARYDAAVESLTEGRDTLVRWRTDESFHSVVATADYFLAMAHHRGGARRRRATPFEGRKSGSGRTCRRWAALT